VEEKFAVYVDNHGITYIVKNEMIKLFESSVSVYSRSYHSSVVINPINQIVKAKKTKVSRSLVSAFISKYIELDSVIVRATTNKGVSYENGMQ